MKIRCPKGPLQTAFQIAAMVAPTRTPKEILVNVKFEILSDSATLMATDLENSVRVRLADVEITKPGLALLNVARFGSILRESQDEFLQIETNDRGCVVKGQRMEFKLPAENPDEFPSVPDFREEKYHSVGARLFREMVNRTEFATDTESSRYALSGVLLEMVDDKIIAVGTDGRRLACMSGAASSVGGHSTIDNPTIVRTQSIKLLAKSIADGEGEVKLASRGNDLIAMTPMATFSSRLVEGRFPKWRDVIPTRPNAPKVEFTVAPLHAAIRQAAIVSGDDTRGILFSFSEGELTLSNVNARFGESKVELPINYSGPKIGVSLDHRYVSDFLRVLPGDKVITCELEDPNSAVLFVTDEGYQYVIMPLNRD